MRVRKSEVISSLLLSLVFACAWSTAEAATCFIQDSPCYPWRIDQEKSDTSLLEIVPNNTVSGMIYRVCVCPPGKGISVVFDYQDNSVELGSVKVNGEGSICRDFRIQTSRTSRLLVRRLEGKEAIEGCYTSP